MELKKLDRILHYIYFCLFWYSVQICQLIAWRFNGIYKKLCQIRTGQLYEESAHVLDIHHRFKYSPFGMGDLGSFIAYHSGFRHTRCILKTNVTLYYVSKYYAVFVETEDSIDVMNSVEPNTSMYQAQFTHAKKLIVLPMASFIQIGYEIGNPQTRVVVLSQTGQDGCQLISGIFNKIDDIATIMEPDALWSPLYLQYAGMVKFTEKEYMRCIGSTIRVLCKSAPDKHTVCIMLRPFCMSLVKVIKEEIPTIKHLFVYGQIVETMEASELVTKRWPLSYKLPAFLKWNFALNLWLYFLKNRFKKVLMDQGIKLLSEHKWIEKAYASCSITGLSSLHWGILCLLYMKLRDQGTYIAAIKLDDIHKNQDKFIETLLTYCNIKLSSLSSLIMELEDDGLLPAPPDDDIPAPPDDDIADKPSKGTPWSNTIRQEVDGYFMRLGLPSLADTHRLEGTVWFPAVSTNKGMGI